MTTIVNSPAAPASDSSGLSGMLMGLVLLLVITFLFFFYGLPALRSATQQAPNNVNIEVPKQVDVNVNENPGQ